MTMMSGESFTWPWALVDTTSTPISLASIWLPLVPSLRFGTGVCMIAILEASFRTSRVFLVALAMVARVCATKVVGICTTLVVFVSRKFKECVALIAELLLDILWIELKPMFDKLR